MKTWQDSIFLVFDLPVNHLVDVFYQFGAFKFSADLKNAQFRKTLTLEKVIFLIEGSSSVWELEIGQPAMLKDQK